MSDANPVVAAADDVAALLADGEDPPEWPLEFSVERRNLVRLDREEFNERTVRVVPDSLALEVLSRGTLAAEASVQVALLQSLRRDAAEAATGEVDALIGTLAAISALLFDPRRRRLASGGMYRGAEMTSIAAPEALDKRGLYVGMLRVRYWIG